MPRPAAADFPPYFARYINQVAAENLSEAVRNYAEKLADFYMGLPESKASFSYAPGKWTLKELLQHIVDTERIMSYRLLRIARKDKTPLASFDEDFFASHSNANERNFDSIKEEFLSVRRSTDLLIASLNEIQLSEEGISGNLPITANAVGFIIFGHMLHHKNILEERYL